MDYKRNTKIYNITITLLLHYYNIININLKTYNTILKHTIRAAKKVYFENRLSRFKNDIKIPGKLLMNLFQKSNKIKNYHYLL